MNKNIVTLTDSYKLNHWNQYPVDTEKVYSYFESRNGAKWEDTVFFGLQYLIKEYLLGKVVTREKIEQGQRRVDSHLGPGHFNRQGWEHILNKHDGKLPVRICAVPEGMPVPVSNVLMTIENTDPKCFWLTNHLETLLTHVWSASTVATLSREVKKVLKWRLDETTDYDEKTKNAILGFQLHDFGMRGVSSMESAGIEGAGHLVNFLGTDTVIAMDCAEEYYSAKSDGLAYSVPATEHSVMTARGEQGEEKVLDDLLDNYPDGTLSVVGDSYNIDRFINKYVAERKEKILARQPNANGVCKFVVRPDSLRHKNDKPYEQMVWIMDSLHKIFGGTINTNYYTVLNPKVGTLWGDGIDKNGIQEILLAVRNNRYSTESLVFGMGGGLLQKINRDIQRFAFKCSAQRRSGNWHDISKTPLDKSKRSKAGKLALVRRDGKVQTVNAGTTSLLEENLLRLVFENGSLLRNQTFANVRENACL